LIIFSSDAVKAVKGFDINTNNIKLIRKPKRKQARFQSKRKIRSRMEASRKREITKRRRKLLLKNSKASFPT
jgi:hypothetical protein